MARCETPEEFVDRDFERLFKTFDNIEASDELKDAALDAIFDQMDAEQGDAEQNSLAERGDISTKAGGCAPLRLAEDEPAPSNEGRATARKKKRDKGWVLRVAAVALVVAIGIGGGLAYALPVSHVVLTTDDATFDLGMNMFGMTVSATSGSTTGTSVLTKAQVHNLTLDDAIKNLMGAYEGQGGSVNVSVDAFNGFGGKDSDLSQRAQEAVQREVRGRDTGSKESMANGSDAQQQDAPAQVDGRQEQETKPREETGVAEQQGVEPRQDSMPRDEAARQDVGGQNASREEQSQRVEPESHAMSEQGDRGSQMGQDAQGQKQNREQSQAQEQGPMQGQGAQNDMRQNQPMSP